MVGNQLRKNYQGSNLYAQLTKHDISPLLSPHYVGPLYLNWVARLGSFNPLKEFLIKII
jgi:hypothetical protein